MTREEARKHMMLWVYSLDDMPPKQVVEALAMAADALRPISREQVKKAWKGEPVERHDPYHLILWTACPRCGYEFMDECPEDFCPKCGIAFTDEAVEMVMERLNELNNEEEN